MDEIYIMPAGTLGAITYYVIKNKSTVRETASVFEVSKSTVHKDLQERLSEIDKATHERVADIFKEHIEIRHIRGGESTKRKYKKEG